MLKNAMNAHESALAEYGSPAQLPKLPKLPKLQRRGGDRLGKERERAAKRMRAEPRTADRE